MSTDIINSIPATLNDLLVELKILSKLERGTKINMGTMSFVDSSSWLGALGRSILGEGRKSLMIHLNQLVQQSISAIGEYRDTEFCRLVVNELAQAKLGIQTLAITYQQDPVMVAQVEVWVSNINIQLEKNRHLLDGHQPGLKPLSTITSPSTTGATTTTHNQHTHGHQATGANKKDTA